MLASSGEAEQTSRLLALVEGSDRVDGRTSSADVDRSKPAPDLVDAAVETEARALAEAARALLEATARELAHSGLDEVAPRTPRQRKGS